MALTNAMLDHLSLLAQFASRAIDERDDAFIGNYEWAGVPNFDGLITQQELDAFTAAFPDSPLANLTLTDIVEVEYVRSTLLGLLDDKFPQLYAVRKAAQ